LPSRADIFFVKTKEASSCPICGEGLIMRGWRSRMMIKCGEEKIKLKIRRMKCRKCKRIHHELPDCVVPYKRHSAETIEEVIRDIDSAPCDTRTMGRIASWWQIVLPYFLNVLKSLSEKYCHRFQEPPKFKEIIQATVNTNNWATAQSICTRTVFMSG